VKKYQWAQVNRALAVHDEHISPSQASAQAVTVLDHRRHQQAGDDKLRALAPTRWTTAVRSDKRREGDRADCHQDPGQCTG